MCINSKQGLKIDKNKNSESVSCPICGNEKLQTISKKGQFRLPCYVSICPSDGLVFLSPRWTKERYMEFYQNEYDSYHRPSVLNTETENQKYGAIKIIFSRLENLKLINDMKSVLDIGAGMGWSLQYIKYNYPDFQRVAAIETSSHCIRNLREVVGASIVSTDVDDNWKSTDFDLVIMRHALEHFMNPIDVLRKVGENLSENGVVYIAVPDMMHPKGSLINYWFRAVHTFYFSEATLNTMASIANLELIEIKTENTELWGVFKKSTRFSQKQNEQNVYEKQLLLIKEYQRKTVFLDAKIAIKQIGLYLLPSGIKSWLKKIKNNYRMLK